MNRKLYIMTTLLVLAMLALSGCSTLIPQTGVSKGDQAATQQAFIVQAAQATATGIAIQTQISQLQTQVAQGGAASDPIPATAVAGVDSATATPTATATQTSVPPTATDVPPTVTPLPSFTPRPPTATPIPCNSAQFISDVTIPDGTSISAGGSFTKTWRLKNTGSCTWSTSYDIVFMNGDKMNGPSAVDMPGSVAPGQVIDISVDFVAPSSTGSYRSNWKLRDASGVIFGLGQTGATFYVDIKVPSVTSKYPLDFVGKMCSATWTTGDGTLDCPGANNDASGFVLRVDNPKLETGYQDDEPALITYPQMITNGYIRGKYPAIRVKSGYHFVAIIGCAYNADDCDVKFSLDYQVGSGTVTNLMSKHEVYDENFTKIDIDLSSLAGKDVKFILTVRANGSSTGDRAQWFAPRIIKE